MESTVGQQLIKAREMLGISIEDAARATHIKMQYLHELENDHPELLPSPANARGFLRLYASFLRIQSQPLLAIWDNPPKPGPVQLPAEKKMQPEAVLPQVDEKLVEETGKEKKAEISPEEKPIEPTAAAYTDKLSQRQRSRKKSVRVEITPEESAATESSPGPALEVSPLSDLALALPSEEPLAEKEPAASERIPEVLHPPQRSSSEYFTAIGSALHERRETLKLSLADIERFTHIKRPYLEALEAGRFSELPSTVQGRGMLNNYVSFLSMDDDAVMGLYAAALEAQRQERLPPRKPEPIVTGGIRINIPAPLKKYMNPDLLLGSVVILAMFIFLLWGSVQVFTQQNPKATLTAPSISEVLQTTPTVLATPDLTLTPQGTPALVAVLPDTKPAATPLATKKAAPLQVYIVAQQRAFLKVTVDGKVAFDGRVLPGNVYTYFGQKSIELLTGNAAALEVYFNQEFLGKLGEVGQVVSLSFNDKGVSAPVSTSTPTPTAPPKPAPTQK